MMVKSICGNCKSQVTISLIPLECKNCKWYNKVVKSPSKIFDKNLQLTPVITKEHHLSDGSLQISYPPISKEDLEPLSEKLKNAFQNFLENPNELIKKEYENLYHNIYSKGGLKKKIVKLKKIKKLSKFLKDTNFLKKKIVRDDQNDHL